MKGAEILIDGLIKEGVDTIFGYPGGVMIPVFDVLYSTKEIKFILTRHEQGATHAADGYARSTGKTGVVFVTSGPGATNTITGIATAKMDSVPIVVVTGQVSTKSIGTDAFQETDMSGLTRSICKHNYLVNHVRDLPRVIKEAFYIANSGRPGPVSIDLPVDVVNDSLPDYKYPETIDLPGYKPVVKGHINQIKKLAEAIKNAEKPLLYTGGGIISSSAHNNLLQFISKTNIPVITTLMGLGSIPYDHPRFVGMPGMHGVAAANYALTECDLLISVGARFDDRITGPAGSFAKQAKIAHVDIDPAEIGKVVKTDIPVVGDANYVLEKLTEMVDNSEYVEWNSRMSELKMEYPLHYDQKAHEYILPQYAIDMVNKFTTDDAIIVTDVGQHQMWCAQFIKYKQPRCFLSSGGLGTMGYGLPAAMGAQVANPDRRVVAITGDGGIQMNIQELATCAINNIPVKVVVINNSYLGMVRQWQDLFWDGKFSQTCLKKTPDCPDHCKGPNGNCPNRYWPNLEKVAEANGVKGFRVESVHDLEKTFSAAFAHKGPALIEVMVDKLTNVFPMIPSGKKNNEILFGDEK
ncbi:MAG: biosynthetic-type acetolactate synthase large subunit [Candidatus Marinimicrobia bacterium]|nr:biosynthetic-type acetolactate synthase large subunit [Candidatus Neomarinimicrobiota bacterium]